VKKKIRAGFDMSDRTIPLLVTWQVPRSANVARLQASGRVVW
jgi:hypothetical protein